MDWNGCVANEKWQMHVIIITIVIINVLFLSSYHSGPFPCFFLEHLSENTHVFFQTKTFLIIKGVNTNNLL